MMKKPTSQEFQRLITRLEKESAERKRLEIALTESEERYRALMERSSDAILVLDPERRILSCNQAFLGLFGYRRSEVEGQSVRIIYGSEELTSRPFIEFIHPDDRKMVYARDLERLRGEGTTGPYMFRMLNRHGDFLWVEVIAVLSAWQGKPATVSFLTDVTERLRGEEALKASEERYRDLYDNAPVGYHEIDADGRITRVNRTELDMLGYTAQEVLGRYMWEFVAEEEAGSRLRAKLSGDIPIGMPFERTFRRKDGTPVPVLIEERPVRSHEGQIVGIRSTIQDISGVKQAEERIHVLSQELVQAHERERQTISLELHDRVAQDLSTVKIGLDTLLYAWPGISAESKKQVSDLSGVIQKTISAVRDLAYDLRPPSLDQLGLVQSMYQYCEEFSQKSGLVVDFTCAGMDELSLDSDTEINLYRLVQEGLINVRKHAEASHVVLRLVASFPNIILRIVDDGKGFDVEERRRSLTRERRMGLRSMEERVRWLGGSMDVKSSPGKGTRIAIRIPHKEKEGAKEEKPADRG